MDSVGRVTAVLGAPTKRAAGDRPEGRAGNNANLGPKRVCVGARGRLFLKLMQDVTEVLDAVARGEPEAAGRPLPLVYDELRHLAAQKLAREKPGQTLQALVGRSHP